MKTHLQHGKQNVEVSNLRAVDTGEPGVESEELKSDLRIFRDSLRAAAERPDAFWANQRAGIMERLRGAAAASGGRPALLWAPAAIVIVLCLFFFVEKSKAPTPDFAAGSDQMLLIEVEQALHRNYPEALAPAVQITRQIDQASGPAEHPVIKK